MSHSSTRTAGCSASLLVDADLNSVGGFAHALVFPDSDHGPTVCLEPLGGIAISGPVRFELSLPPVPVRARDSAVRGTCVPPTGPDENGDTDPRKHDVGLSSQSGDWAAMNVVAEASAKQLGTKGELD